MGEESQAMELVGRRLRMWSVIRINIDPLPMCEVGIRVMLFRHHRVHGRHKDGDLGKNAESVAEAAVSCEGVRGGALSVARGGCRVKPHCGSACFPATRMPVKEVQIDAKHISSASSLAGFQCVAVEPARGSATRMLCVEMKPALSSKVVRAARCS